MAPSPVPIRRRPVLATAALVAGGLLPVGLGPPGTAAPPAAPLVDATVRQVVVVVTPSWEATTGRLAWFERAPAGAWRRAAEPVQVTVGRAGLGWGLGLHPDPAGAVGPAKREGDGRSPAGVFSIGIAFGAAATLDTGLPYKPLDGDDWCVDVAASPLYNRIVGRRDVGGAAVAGSTELMRRDLAPTADGQYAVGFTIGHNPAGQAGMGSCIFAHVRAGPGVPTSGCTGFAEDDLRRLLAWLRADARPLMVLLPAAEAARLGAWGLPDAALVTGDGP